MTILAALTTQHFLWVLYLLVLFCFVFLIRRIHKGDNTYSVSDLFVDEYTNKLSLSKIGKVVALITSTWLIFYLAASGGLSEMIVGLYMATWAGAATASQYINSKVCEHRQSEQTKLSMIQNKLKNNGGEND